MSKHLCAWVSLWLCLVVSSCATGDPENLGDRNELGMWENVLQQQMPAYPASGLASGTQGAVVSELVLQPSGIVSRVKVLEAPDPDIAAATADALRRWTFHPTIVDRDEGPIPIRGKISLYFVIENGHGSVQTPSERAASRRTTALTR